MASLMKKSKEVGRFDELAAHLNVIPPTKEGFPISKDVTSVVGVPFNKHLQTALKLLIAYKCTECHRLSKTLLEITWEHLNTGHWKDVDINWRHAYSYLSLFKALCEVACSRAFNTSCETETFTIQDAISTCDMGLLMGAPVMNNILTKLVTKLQSLHVANTKHSTEVGEHTQNTNLRACEDSNTNQSHAIKKQKISHSASINITHPIPTVSCPSVECFCNNHFVPLCPVVLKDTIGYWPALTTRRWSLDYLRRVAGCRTVPIEIGSRYTDDDWSQSLMTLNDFINKYISAEEEDTNPIKDPQGESQTPSHIVRPAKCTIFEGTVPFLYPCTVFVFFKVFSCIKIKYKIHIFV